MYKIQSIRVNIIMVVICYYLKRDNKKILKFHINNSFYLEISIISYKHPMLKLQNWMSSGGTNFKPISLNDWEYAFWLPDDKSRWF